MNAQIDLDLTSATPAFHRVAMRGNDSLRIRSPHIPTMHAFHLFEQGVYAALGKLSKEYTGGSWRFYHLSTDTTMTWFMAPKDVRTLTLQDWQGRDSKMSAEGAGLAAMLCLLSDESFRFDREGNGEACKAASAHFYALRAYAATTKDASAIHRVLD